MKTQILVGLKPLVAIGALAISASVRADIVGSYTVDAHTLHLWHVDETALPVADAVVAGGFAVNIPLISLLNGKVAKCTYQPLEFACAPFDAETSCVTK